MSLHDYEEPPLPKHDYEEPSEELRMRFGSPDSRSEQRTSPVPPRRWAKPSAVAPSKLIVPRATPLPAPDFKPAHDSSRPARPPTPDWSLLGSPSPSSSPKIVKRDRFQFHTPAVEQLMRRSRSESDLLADSDGGASPLFSNKLRKMSEAEITHCSRSPGPVARKPKPLPRRSVKDLLAVERKMSSPPTLEDVMPQKPVVWPRRRAITDGGLIANPDVDPAILMYQNVSPEKVPGSGYTRVGQPVSNPYEHVNRKKSEGSPEVADIPPVPKRKGSENPYYQLELTTEPAARPSTGRGGAEEGSQGLKATPSTSSDVRSPQIPGFLHPLSSFTSVNTLPHANDSWSREAAAAEAKKKHNYSNMDAIIVADAEVFSAENDNPSEASEHSAMPVSSSDSALGTLDKDKNGFSSNPPPPLSCSPEAVSTSFMCTTNE